MNNAGLPGLGLGGLFYLLSAVGMLIVEVVRFIKHRPTQWGVVLYLLGITVASVAATYGTYWVFDHVLTTTGAGGTGQVVSQVLRHTKPIIWTSGILVALLFLVRVVGLFLPKPQPVSVRK
jgi:hypothetical protein